MLTEIHRLALKNRGVIEWLDLMAPDILGIDSQRHDRARAEIKRALFATSYVSLLRIRVFAAETIEKHLPPELALYIAGYNTGESGMNLVEPPVGKIDPDKNYIFYRDEFVLAAHMAIYRQELRDAYIQRD
jgi:hypothetical protein